LRVGGIKSFPGKLDGNNPGAFWIPVYHMSTRLVEGRQLRHQKLSGDRYPDGRCVPAMFMEMSSHRDMWVPLYTVLRVADFLKAGGAGRKKVKKDVEYFSKY